MPTEKDNAARIDVNSGRIDRLEKLVEEHLVTCTRQKEQIEKLAEFVENVNASLRLANIARSIVIWFSGLFAAIYAIWHATRGGGQ